MQKALGRDVIFTKASEVLQKTNTSIRRLSLCPVRPRAVQRTCETGMVVIAISGPHGSGKTSVARYLAKKIGLRYVCSGDIFRQMAKERGMSLEEFSRYAEEHPQIDLEIDRRMQEEARKGQVVLDSRLAAWLVDADFKILLVAPLEARVQRIAKREGRRREEVLSETLVRERSEARRFKKLYNIDLENHSVFDLVVNTDRFTEDQVKEIIGSLIEMILDDRKG